MKRVKCVNGGVGKSSHFLDAGPTHTVKEQILPTVGLLVLSFQMSVSTVGVGWSGVNRSAS